MVSLLTGEIGIQTRTDEDSVKTAGESCVRTEAEAGGVQLEAEGHCTLLATTRGQEGKEGLCPESQGAWPC